MKIISLLTVTDARVAGTGVAADLQLEGMLSPRALRVLRYSCGIPRIETIKARQEFFTRMDDPTFEQRLDAFRSALFRLSKQIELYGASRVDMERLYLEIRALEAYLAVCRALQALDGTARLISDACQALGDEAHSILLDRLEADLARLERLLAPMERSVFLLTESALAAENAWLLRDSGEATFGEELAALASQMEIELPAVSRRAVKQDAFLGSAYEKLYKDEISEIRAILTRYAEIDLSAPLCWLEEVSFFYEIHGLVRSAREQGIPICLPSVAEEKCYRAWNAYDITLTRKDCPEIVPNDIDFTADTPFFFLTGANGGGKTTYLRAVGVNLLFFLAGCPIFAERAEIYPFSAVFTHFPEDETFSGMGRLDREKERVDRILEQADSNSFILFNETFSATDEEKGFALAMETAEVLRERGIFGLYVTHFLEVKSKGFPILSAMVEEDGTNRRTFKIRRSSGTASSYAQDILRKYKLDSASLEERRKSR